MGSFEQLAEDEVYQGAVIRVSRGSFRSPDGEHFQRDIVRHPGAVSVVPVVDDGTTVLLLRQFRAAVGRTLLEIPAGKRDVEGEPIEETARRELIEEIGMRAGRLHKLAEFHNSPGFCDEHSVVFLGLDLEAVEGGPDRQGPEERDMTVERVGLDDVPRLIRDAAITDAKTIIGLALAREELAR